MTKKVKFTANEDEEVLKYTNTFGRTIKISRRQGAQHPVLVIFEINGESVFIPEKEYYALWELFGHLYVDDYGPKE